MTGNMPTIWHISKHARLIGGIEQNVFLLAKGLSEKGFKQRLVAIDEENSDSNYISAFNAATLVDIKESLEPPRISEKPDVIIVHNPLSGQNLAPWNAIAPIIRVVHDHDLVCPRKHKYFPITHRLCTQPAGSACIMHGCLIGRNGKRPVLHSLKATSISISEHRQLNAIIVGSRFMKNELVLNGISESSISIVPPLPADLSCRSYISHPANRRILYVGQLVRGKGVDLLLRALKLMGNNWQLEIIGNGNMRANLEKLAKKLSIEPYVKFYGNLPHKDVLAAYANAHIVVVPSRWPEPFGMVGLEAMAAARPVVGFATGGIPDWLRHGYNGFAASPTDIEQFAEMVDWLLRDATLAADLGANGRKLLETDFSYSKYIEKMSDIVRQFAAEQGK